MQSPYGPVSRNRYQDRVVRAVTLASPGMLFANPVYAIPSPELVIGSISSVSQLLALGAAMLGGGAAAVGVRAGAKANKDSRSAKMAIRIAAGLFVVVVLSAALNIFQFLDQRQQAQARLQSTLTRPAVTVGSGVVDPNLKVTTLEAQTEHNLGITTDDADALLTQVRKRIETEEIRERFANRIPGHRGRFLRHTRAAPGTESATVLFFDKIPYPIDPIWPAARTQAVSNVKPQSLWTRRVRMFRYTFFAAMTAIPLAFGTVGAKAADIVDTAVSAGDFETLVAAVKAAGLVETLKGEGPFTVFAPTDEAFAKLPAGTLEDLLKPENKDKLTAILTYHVVPGKVMSGDIAGKKMMVETVEGSKLSVNATDGVKIDDAKVISADIATDNGVIHVIDTVVLPK